MKILSCLWLWCVMIGWADSSSQYEDVLLSKYGVLLHKTNTEVIVKNDGLIMTFIYDPGELSAYWNEFVEKSDHILQFIGNKNTCVNELISKARSNRNNMKNYTDTIGLNVTVGITKHKNKRIRRQIALFLAGAINLAQFGFTEFQIHEINKAITNIKLNVSHNAGSIKILDKAIKIISKKVKAVEHNEFILQDEMGKLTNQLGELINLNEHNAQDIACLQLTITFNKRENVIKELKHELDDILNFNFNKDIIDLDVRKNVCNHIVEAGLETHGKCNNLNMIEIVDLVFVGKKLVMITKIPIKNQVDDFRLANIIALPVKIKDNFVKIKNIDMQIAMGEKYMIKIAKCKRYKNKKFCEGTSAFRSIKNDTNSCIGNILSKSNKVIDQCNWEPIPKMEDYFYKVLGTYFFSINRTITLELVCAESKDNARVSLQGLGSVIIKKGCMAKFDSILLVGSDAANLNTSFEIKLKENKKEFMGITEKFSLIHKLNRSRSQWQQTKYNHSADLIHLSNISPQDINSIQIDSELFTFIKIFLGFCCVSSGLYIIKIICQCLKLESNCKLDTSNNKKKKKVKKTGSHESEIIDDC